MKSKRFGNKVRMGGKYELAESETSHSATFGRTNRYRAAILAACDRLEKGKEFKAQHGTVRIIMADGKPVDPVAQ